MIKTTVIETPLGEMKAAAVKEGICLLAFADSQNLGSDLEELERIFGSGIRSGSNWHLWALKRQLKEYFKGKRKEFSLKLVTPGTDFQKEVWNGLKEIPYGSTISYQEQAEKLNNPGAIRAVGHANGSNRIAIVIPCHRVIGADGSLTGYGGGLERKRWLIDHEKKYSGKPVDGTLF
ncbi:MAG: methylated-DNA--[protein]-cysteine S-methyltransferase [Bacteroidales bacterium]|nr:methylated-DNA--[protein]-cysteine S-methyltransferase [Bacteroidales bacterium]